MNDHHSQSCIFLILALLCSCSKSEPEKTAEEVHNSDHLAWTSKDSWYAPAPLSYGSREVSIPRKHFHELDSAHAPAAMKMLENAPIVPLTRKEAADLGVHLSADKSLKPYLVRALYLNYLTGGYFLGESGDTLLVSHGSLGHSAAPMTRSSLIVELKNEPHVLFIEVSMAE